jgi:hypothetical protein
MSLFLFEMLRIAQPGTGTTFSRSSGSKHPGNPRRRRLITGILLTFPGPPIPAPPAPPERAGPAITVLNFCKYEKNSLKAFCDLHLPSGLIPARLHAAPSSGSNKLVKFNLNSCVVSVLRCLKAYDVVRLWFQQSSSSSCCWPWLR